MDNLELHEYCTIETDSLLNRLALEPAAVFVNGYVYIDNWSPVLAVAHADVHPRIERSISFQVEGSSQASSIVRSTYLDDRLGVYAILERLPELGVTVDVLITSGEETGHSTAGLFAEKCLKNYNWVVEFDRKGEDVVLYEYSNNRMERLLEDSGFTIGTGTSSDISHMDSLGIACFNVGIGFFEEHHYSCWADLRILDRQLKRFSNFYRHNKDLLFLDESNNSIS